MSTKEATAEHIARLFTAAGRRAGKPEFAVYHDALTDIDDDELGEAVKLICRNVVFGDKKQPSPAMVREYVMVVRARAPEPAAIPESTGGPVSKEEALAFIAEARSKLKRPNNVVPFRRPVDVGETQ